MGGGHKKRKIQIVSNNTLISLKILYFRCMEKIIQDLRACCTNGKIGHSVMLNLFQHLIKSRGYETLKQVQGDK